MKEEFMDIINDLVDMGDCVYDYHGNCQAHGWFSDKECPHSRAKRVLANAIPISEAPDTKLAREIGPNKDIVEMTQKLIDQNDKILTMNKDLLKVFLNLMLFVPNKPLDDDA